MLIARSSSKWRNNITVSINKCYNFLAFEMFMATVGNIFASFLPVTTELVRRSSRYGMDKAEQNTNAVPDCHGPPLIIMARADSAKERWIVCGSGGACAVHWAWIS